jgi:hypothetical protein
MKSMGASNKSDIQQTSDIHCYATAWWSHFHGNQPMQQLTECISMVTHERKSGKKLCFLFGPPQSYGLTRVEAG